MCRILGWKLPGPEMKVARVLASKDFPVLTGL
jgi:hypothetical protein